MKYSYVEGTFVSSPTGGYYKAGAKVRVKEVPTAKTRAAMNEADAIVRTRRARFDSSTELIAEDLSLETLEAEAWQKEMELDSLYRLIEEVKND